MRKEITYKIVVDIDDDYADLNDFANSDITDDKAEFLVNALMSEDEDVFVDAITVVEINDI